MKIKFQKKRGKQEAVQSQLSGSIFDAVRNSFDFDEVPTPERLIPADFMTRLDWSQCREGNVVFDALEKKAVDAYGLQSFPPLQEDIFTALYQSRVKIQKPEQEQLQLNQRILNALVKNENYKDIRSETRGRTIPAALFAQALGNWAIQYAQELKEKVERHDEENERREEDLPFGEDGEEPLDDIPDFAMEREMQRSMDEAINEAAGGVKAVAEIDNVFGEDAPMDEGEEGGGCGSESGTPLKVNLKERLAIAQHFLNHKDFLEIIELAGRLSRLWEKQEYSRCHGIEEIIDTVLGNDIERVLPSEFARVGYDKEGFYSRFAEKKLVQTEMVGIEPLAKGPVGILQDHSGSMEGARDRDAKAMMFASMMVCRKQKRDFFYLPFESTPGRMRVFPKGQVSLREAYEIVTEFLNGGTEYFSPFKMAIDEIRKNETFRDADIIMISDGVCSLSKRQVETIKSAQQELGFKVLFLAVGIHCNPAKPPPTSLDEIADPILFVQTLQDQKAEDALGRALNRKGGK